MKRRVALLAMSVLATPRPTAAQTLRPVIVGGVVLEDTVPLWYAVDTGLFQKAGLSVDVQRAAGGFAAPLGVISGVYNIANSNLLSVIVAHAKGVPLQIVAFSGWYNGTPEYNAIVVRKDSPLQTAADVNGHVFGTAGVNDLSSLGMRSWMDRHGGDFKTVKVIEVPYSVVMPALDEGRIDVGATLQPYLSSALASGKVRIFADAYQAIAPHFAAVGWVATPTWAAANADTVRRFARVIRDAQTYCNAHRTETATILANHSGVDINTILHGGRETFSQTFAEPKELQPLIDVAAKYGAIDHRFDAAEIISPAIEALAR